MSALQLIVDFWIFWTKKSKNTKLQKSKSQKKSAFTEVQKDGQDWTEVGEEKRGNEHSKNFRFLYAAFTSLLKYNPINPAWLPWTSVGTYSVCNARHIRSSMLHA